MADLAPFRAVALGPVEAVTHIREDGALIVQAPRALGEYPRRLTERLEHWARVAPDRVWLAQRAAGGEWRRVTYAQALASARSIGAALIARGLSAERPLAILSGNSIEHGLLALAALHVGIPSAAISVAYSLISTDFAKLRHIIGVLTPGMVFVDDGAAYATALAQAVPAEIERVMLTNVADGATEFADLLATPPGPADAAAARVGPETVAKFLFTSGSTGTPKGVVNTQLMLCSNQQMILEAFPFLAETPPVLVDWTPWNHTFGGNHDFGLVLYNGGTLYIDDGKPTAAGMAESIRNLREIAPTFYLNVPKGYEELVRYLRAEPEFARHFFSRLQLFFYAGAGIAQHVWDELDSVAVATMGEKIQMLAGFGSTETAPFALLCRPDCAHAGVVGLPSPGITLKLVPNGDKLEARIKGPNVTPGYWRNAEQTAAAFDEEGFYKFGDAMRWVDRLRPELGFAFDGRISEDFKLSTGTWVSVGPLRAKLIAALAPYARDVVIAGIDRDFIAILVIPDSAACQALCPGAADALAHPSLMDAIRAALRTLAEAATGSSTRVVRAHLLREAPSIDRGEITDKGSINQRAVLAARAHLVAALYAEPLGADVISIGDFA